MKPHFVQQKNSFCPVILPNPVETSDLQPTDILTICPWLRKYHPPSTQQQTSQTINIIVYFCNINILVRFCLKFNHLSGRLLYLRENIK